ncbi:peptidylprolyl isomerase [Terrisporobacter glycolicus]|nr:peptidylprolyl isomerase [Terrisporobacter glycolicus]
MALVGCSQGEINDEVRTPPKELPIATIVIKNYGTIEAELYPHIAPNTVNNFISLANSGFYDGLTFHRIIKDFMIQGGDPNGNGSGGPGYSIKGEFTKNKFKNDLKHTEGVLSMARSQNKNSGGSQFFIMTKDSPHLDGQYAAFGKIIKGIDIVHEIENTKTGNNDKPEKDIVIESIKVDTKGIKYDAPEKI